MIRDTLLVFLTVWPKMSKPGTDLSGNKRLMFGTDGVGNAMWWSSARCPQKNLNVVNYISAIVTTRFCFNELVYSSVLYTHWLPTFIWLIEYIPLFFIFFSFSPFFFSFRVLPYKGLNLCNCDLVFLSFNFKLFMSAEIDGYNYLSAGL